MADCVALLSIPGLRQKDVAAMKNLQSLMAQGETADLEPGFPCVTCPVQATMTTGKPPRDHGVVANGFYWREDRRVEMWTAPNDCIGSPQIWDLLHERDPKLTSAVWFPLHSKQCKADYVCTPAPIHNPDGSESLWCYTQPTELYGTLRDKLGHFPLKHFWGPIAGIQSTDWIVDSAVIAAETWRPNFFYIYLPQLDYAAQRTGPDSPSQEKAVAQLDEALGRLAGGFRAAYDADLLWIAAGEYAVTPVSHVSYPNRVLREAGLLSVREEDDGEHLDLAGSRAWAMVDHQLSHIFVADADPEITSRVADIFRDSPGIAEVLSGDQLAEYELDHARSGEVVLVSTPDSWQAYYWWESDDSAPAYARTVDIHRKPGYDPVELHFDPATKSIPLDATLIRGSHGAPVRDANQQTVVLASQPGVLPQEQPILDRDIFDVVMRQFLVTE